MNDDRFSDDRFRAAEFELSLPIKMPFAGSVGFNVPEIADVAFGRVRPAVVFMHRIKMPAS